MDMGAASVLVWGWVVGRVALLTTLVNIQDQLRIRLTNINGIDLNAKRKVILSRTAIRVRGPQGLS